MRRPKKKRRPSPLGPLILFILAATIIYSIAKGTGDKVGAYDAYVIEANKLARGSNEVAKDFDLLRQEAFTITRGEFRDRIDKNYQKSFDIYDQAVAIKPPPSLEEAHAYAKLAFDLRADGMELYGPAMASVLEDDKSPAVLAKISTALRYLILSDEAYLRFEESAKGLLETKGASDPLIASDFIKGEDVADPVKVSAYVNGALPTEIKPVATEIEGATEETQASSPLRGVAIVGLVVKPARIAYDETTKTASLAEVAEVSAEITVENQGDQTESDLTVRVVVKSVSGAEVAVKSGNIIKLAPGEKQVVSIKGIKVVGGGAINLLKATAVPVEGEKTTTNNSREVRLKVG